MRWGFPVLKKVVPACLVYLSTDSFLPSIGVCNMCAKNWIDGNPLGLAIIFCSEYLFNPFLSVPNNQRTMEPAFADPMVLLSVCMPWQIILLPRFTNRLCFSSNEVLQERTQTPALFVNGFDQLEITSSVTGALKAAKESFCSKI